MGVESSACNGRASRGSTEAAIAGGAHHEIGTDTGFDKGGDWGFVMPGETGWREGTYVRGTCSVFGPSGLLRFVKMDQARYLHDVS